MLLEFPPDKEASDTLSRCPKSAAHPAGWESLFGLGPCEVAISKKSIWKCPHFQQDSVRLPLGIEGAIIRRADLYSDVQLREFGQDEGWGEKAVSAHGPLSLDFWRIENSTHPLDFHPNLSTSQQSHLGNLFVEMPKEDSEFC